MTIPDTEILSGGAVWDFATGDSPEDREVVCHNDFAPYNCVFRGRAFAGSICFFPRTLSARAGICTPARSFWQKRLSGF